MCYDVFLSEEKSEFVIVLEDISGHYTAPTSELLANRDNFEYLNGDELYHKILSKGEMK